MRKAKGKSKKAIAWRKITRLVAFNFYLRGQQAMARAARALYNGKDE